MLEDTLSILIPMFCFVFIGAIFSMLIHTILKRIGTR